MIRDGRMSEKVPISLWYPLSYSSWSIFNPALSDKDKLKETLNKLKVFKEVIKRNEGNVNIPSHFIAHAQNEYKRIVNIIQEKVEIDKILDAIFD